MKTGRRYQTLQRIVLDLKELEYRTSDDRREFIQSNFDVNPLKSAIPTFLIYASGISAYCLIHVNVNPSPLYRIPLAVATGSTMGFILGKAGYGDDMGMGSHQKIRELHQAARNHETLRIAYELGLEQGDAQSRRRFV